jgi:8-oxo-dGTP diphosphatase
MKTIEVVGAVIVKDKKIYASQRGYGDFKDGWEFPGGKIEKDELPADAIKREIKEELDADIDVEDYLGVIEYQYPKFILHLHLYICSILSGNLTMLEAEGEKWLDLNELESINWLPADIGALKLIRDYFHN